MAKKKKEVVPVKETVTCYKCVRASGTDFRTGKVDYIGALRDGIAVECLDAHSTEEAKLHRDRRETVCGHGLHVSPTPRLTIQFANKSYRPWRWLEGTVLKSDII